MIPTNYYFISSPLHLMFSVLIAIDKEAETNVAIIDYYIESNSQLFNETLRLTRVFDNVVDFKDEALTSKYRKRKYRFSILDGLIFNMPPDVIHTGTDRSVEFQYTMYRATKINPSLSAYYLDEGTQTYLGHRHMHKIAHNYIDPVLKKLAYGRWWNNPRMIGASKWISGIYATFPHLIHPEIGRKKTWNLPRHHIDSKSFTNFNNTILDLAAVDISSLQRARFVIILTGDSFYHDVLSHLDRIVELLLNFVPKETIALKPHPRSEYLAEFKKKHPELIHLDNRIGFELLLPQFSSHCRFIGDVSSVLFTIQWINPRGNVLSIKLSQDMPQHFTAPFNTLLKQVGVPQLSYHQLEDKLSAEFGSSNQ